MPLPSSALLGTPYSRLGHVELGSPTATGPTSSFGVLLASVGMLAYGAQIPLNVYGANATMLASQPWTKWGDRLHAKAFQ